ncbi:permease [Lachnospiraceae bacterium oral taxon 500]|nr:permease [Lachnospiraceae bacterium oral taxon 500]
MQQFAIIFLSILLEALPFVLIGTIVSSLIEIFVSREWLTEHLPKRSWFAFLVAGLAGIIFPICECAIVPVMRRLVKKGMPVGVAVTFMLATPTINPVVLLSTRFAFLNNFYFPLLRGVFGYLTAIAVGLLITFLSDKEELKTAGAVWQGEAGKHDHDAEETEHEESCACAHSHGHGKHQHDGYDYDDETEHEESCACGHSHGHRKHQHNEDSAAVTEIGDEHDHEHGAACSCGHVHATKRDKPLQIVKSILDHTSHELYEVGRFLILGVLISAAMQTFVPKQYFLALSQNPALSITAMMLLAFVLSLCSEADAFVAASFQGGLPNSAILAFLLFGPMMDIKNMLMLTQGFRMKFIIRLILTIAVVVFIFSSLSAFLF